MTSEQRRVAAESEQIPVDVDDRHGDEDGEDGEQDDDDQRLGAVDEAGADQVDRGHRDDDHGGEDVVPAGRGVVADEQRRRVAAERDRHHRADDHDRGEVAEPRGDPDEPPVAEPLQQVRDQATGGRVADTQLDDGVAQQRGNDAREQEREPDGRRRDRAASPSSAKMPAPTIAPMPRKAAPRTVTGGNQSTPAASRAARAAQYHVLSPAQGHAGAAQRIDPISPLEGDASQSKASGPRSSWASVALVRRSSGGAVMFALQVALDPSRCLHRFEGLVAAPWKQLHRQDPSVEAEAHAALDVGVTHAPASSFAGGVRRAPRRPLRGQVGRQLGVAVRRTEPGQRPRMARGRRRRRPPRHPWR